MQDLMNENCTWMTFEQFSNRFRIRTNFLTYLGILSAVKSAVKVMNLDLSTTPAINFQSRTFKLNSGRIIDITKAKSRDFYHEFLEDDLEPASAICKWRTDYNLNEYIFYNSLPLAKKCTKEPKLIAIQFKIIHNIINCNSNLYKWKITESDVCEFCSSNERDDLIHALCKCEYTNHFLGNIFRKIDPSNRFSGRMGIEDFLFGLEDSAQNVILLLIKRYILNVRTHKLRFSIVHMIQQIYKRIMLDRKMMSSVKFIEKWQYFQELVGQAYDYWERYNGHI